MRTLKLALFAIAAAALVLLVAAACGGDGDGGEAFELPAPGEYANTFTGTMEIRFVEAGVTAAAVQLPEFQTAQLDGEIKIDLRDDGTFTIFGGDGVIIAASIDGEKKVTFTQDPDNPSGGQTGPNGTTLNLNLHAQLLLGGLATNEVPLDLFSDRFLFGNQDVTLNTPSDSPSTTFDFEAAELMEVGEVTIGIVLDWNPPSGGEVMEEEPPPEPDAGDADADMDGEPLSQEEELGSFREALAFFLLTEEDAKEIFGSPDPDEDLIYSILGVEPGPLGPEVDIVDFFAGIFDMADQAAKAAFGNTVFPCGTVIDGRRTVCVTGAGPVPPGEVVMLAMILAGDVPMEDPDHTYIYSAVFDADGDPANNFQFVEPFNWDFFQGTDRWYELKWDHQRGQRGLWVLEVTVVEDQFRQLVPSRARVVIDGRVIVFFIPIDEFGVPRPAYRLTAFGTDGSYTPEASGGDVTGADPTEPLLPLPEESIFIDEVEDVPAPDG